MTSDDITVPATPEDMARVLGEILRTLRQIDSRLAAIKAGMPYSAAEAWPIHRGAKAAPGRS